MDGQRKSTTITKQHVVSPLCLDISHPIEIELGNKNVAAALCLAIVCNNQDGTESVHYEIVKSKVSECTIVCKYFHSRAGIGPRRFTFCEYNS